MGQPLEITRLEHSSAALREIALRTRDGDVVRRLLAIALVMDGQSRSAAATACGMDRQVLRDWLLRYNEGGVASLSNRPLSGRPPRLAPEQMDQIRRIVLDGPDVEKHGVVRWRCTDLQAENGERFRISVHVSTIGKWLGKLNLTRLQQRPAHPGKSAEKEADFKKLQQGRLPGGGRAIRWRCHRNLVSGRSPGRPAGYIGLCLRRTRQLRDCRRIWAYIFGAVCPARAVSESLVMPFVNTDAMNKHLQLISHRAALGAHAALIVDGAGWHRVGGELVVPDNITLIPLPPYCPELNPIENIWEYLRGNKLNMTVWETYDAIVDACCAAWHFFINDPERVKSITNRDWARVND